MGDMSDFTEKINLDELYETKKQKDLNKLETYNRILNRIHNKIKHVSRQRCEQHCWFVVPEMILGLPRYDNSDCIAYIVQKLRDNGFAVKYTHPNMLFISWQNWVPDYVRTEIKKKMNVNINGFGEVVEKTKAIDNDEGDKKTTGFFDLNDISNKGNKDTERNKERKKEDYKKVDSFKPANKIYSDIFLEFE